MNEFCNLCGGTGKKKVTTNRNEVCNCNKNRYCVLCRGTGYKQTSKIDIYTCDNCRGTGKIQRYNFFQPNNQPLIQPLNKTSNQSVNKSQPLPQPGPIMLNRRSGCSTCGRR